jgi:hypothetical protein
MSNTTNLTQSQLEAQLPQGVRLCVGWVWIGDIDVLALIRSSAGAGDDGGAGDDLLGHDSSGLCGGGRAVDVLISDDMPKRLRVGNQALCSLWRNGLTALIVTNVPLSAAHPSSKCGLGDAQGVPD